LAVEYEYIESADSLQNLYKTQIEAEKILQINNNIQQYKMIWAANKTSVSKLSYSEKRSLFGENYNLIGLDYYSGGVYDPSPGNGEPEGESNLVEEFDWRNRHGANDPDKYEYYYISNRLGEGWLTSIKDQIVRGQVCKGLCYIYGPVAVVEGLVNIYYNSFLDIDLSEQHSLDCDGYDGDPNNNCPTDCDGGVPNVTIQMFNTVGVHDEISYPIPEDDPYDPPYPCLVLNSGEFINKIQTPNGATLIGMEPGSNCDEVKEGIILHGPLITTLNSYSNDKHHTVALIGYGKIKAGDIFHENPNIGNATFIVNNNSPYIGYTYWIFKNRCWV
jgi:hypothetical protein